MTRWIVSQVGRREDYAGARAFKGAGNLARLYTDCWVPKGHAALRVCPRAVRDLRNRFHPGLAGESVVSFTPRFVAGHVLRLARGWPRGAAALREYHLGLSQDYDRCVSSHLRRHGPGQGAKALLGFSTGALETFSAASEMGLSTVLDQVDPAQVEDDIVIEEESRWPGWEPGVTTTGPAAYRERLRQEWARADVVLVNSEFSRDALVRQGVSRGKLIVVPLAFEWDAAAAGRADRSGRAGRKLRVLWLGSVILRKGIQYLVQAARSLASADIEFLVAGPIGISQEAIRQFPPNMRLLGKVSGPPKADLYRSADVFVLPTLSDGFAITQIEAMSFGLPVIATPNCGRVVTPGRDGFIVPVRDGNALAEALAALNQDRGLLGSMSEQAMLKSRQFSVARYGQVLREELRRICFRGEMDAAMSTSQAGTVGAGFNRLLRLAI